LADFPELGPAIGGGFGSRRFLVGPWRWLIVIYEVDATADTVVILRVVDGRTSNSPLGRR
jgi:plasmid stabilization system protein ParE